MRAAKKFDASCNDSGRYVQVAHISRCCPPIERDMATLVDAGGGVEADTSMLVIGRPTVKDVFDFDPFFSRQINAKDLSARPLIAHIRPVAQWAVHRLQRDAQFAHSPSNLHDWPSSALKTSVKPKKTGAKYALAANLEFQCQTIPALHRNCRCPTPKFQLSIRPNLQSTMTAPSLAAAMPIVLSAEAVAEMLGCEVETVHTQAASGNLPGLKFGRSWCFPTDALTTSLSALALAEAERRRTLTQPLGVSVRKSQKREPPRLPQF